MLIIKRIITIVVMLFSCRKLENVSGNCAIKVDNFQWVLTTSSGEILPIPDYEKYAWVILYSTGEIVPLTPKNY